MSIIAPKSLSLSSSKMLIIMIMILLEITSSVHSDIRLDDSSDPNTHPKKGKPVHKIDIQVLQFAQNIEHLEADFFLWGALGYGLDKVAPELTNGGPPPTGARKANLDNLTSDIITEFAYEEVGHLRIIKKTVGSVPRPLIDLSPENFAKIVNKAFDSELKPLFDPYRDSLSYVLSSYIIPYLGLTGYVGANALVKGHVTRRLLAGLLGVESGQDAVIRQYLYERRSEIVKPYNFTVEEFTKRISDLRNKLGKTDIKDEGIVVPPEQGAEGKSSANVLAADRDSVAYDRTPAQILRVLYETGDEHVPGGFYPKGGNGEVAKKYLKKP